MNTTEKTILADEIMDTIYEALNEYVKAQGVLKIKNLPFSGVIRTYIKLLILVLSTGTNNITVPNTVLAKHFKCDTRKVSTRMGDQFKKYNLGQYSSTTNLNIFKDQDIEGNDISTQFRKEPSLYTITLNPEILKVIINALGATDVDLEKLEKDYEEALPELAKIKKTKGMRMVIRKLVSENVYNQIVYTMKNNGTHKTTSLTKIDNEGNEEVVYANKVKRVCNTTEEISEELLAEVLPEEVLSTEEELELVEEVQTVEEETVEFVYGIDVEDLTEEVLEVVKEERYFKNQPVLYFVESLVDFRKKVMRKTKEECSLMACIDHINGLDYNEFKPNHNRRSRRNFSKYSSLKRQIGEICKK